MQRVTVQLVVEVDDDVSVGDLEGAIDNALAQEAQGHNSADGVSDSLCILTDAQGPKMITVDQRGLTWFKARKRRATRRPHSAPSARAILQEGGRQVLEPVRVNIASTCDTAPHAGLSRYGPGSQNIPSRIAAFFFPFCFIEKRLPQLIAYDLDERREGCVDVCLFEGRPFGCEEPAVIEVDD
jgi:hypothetical protein